MPAVRIPSSTSNLGAGFDFVGLALDIWLHAQIVEGGGPTVYLGALDGFDSEDDYTVKALKGLIPDGHHLEVKSDIPVSRGLGSSAAAIVAGLSLAQLLSVGEVNRDAVFESATRQEGHPDNAGPAVYGGLFLHAGFPQRLTFHEELGVALGIPDQILSTKEARGVLPTHLPREEAIAQASSSAALLLGLTQGDGDLIRHGMIDSIAVPKRRSMIKGYDDAVKAGFEAGAYGVTISGAGSTLVAVCARASAPDVADALASTLTDRGNPATALNPAVVNTGLEILRR
jgi:homoserine kinase